MLKNLVILCLVGSSVAYPSSSGVRSKEEVEELKEFLLKSQKDGDITLEEAMTKNPKASPWENSGKYQGDIVLMDEEIEDIIAEYAGNGSSSRNAMLNSRHHWPGGVIIYDIAPNTFNNAQLQMIQQAANFFHETTCTRWQRRTSERDYVLITGRSDGCYATVGYWQNFGAHTLNLATNGCFDFFIVVHEMLHSAGFHHMHQTFNRNDWVWINFQNIVRGMEHNFDMHSSQVVSMLGLPYEYASNQHYGAWAFSANGQPTIVARYNDDGQMGQLSYISGFDVWRLARLYNCPGAWRVQVNPRDANKPYNEEFGKVLRAAAEDELKERQAMLDQALAKKKWNL